MSDSAIGKETFRLSSRPTAASISGVMWLFTFSVSVVMRFSSIPWSCSRRLICLDRGLHPVEPHQRRVATLRDGGAVAHLVDVEYRLEGSREAHHIECLVDRALRLQERERILLGDLA